RAGSAWRLFASRELEATPRGHSGAQPVAGIVVGQNERVAARAVVVPARAVVCRRGMAGVMIQAPNAVRRYVEVRGEEAEAVALSNAELAGRRIDEPELGPELADALDERTLPRRPTHAVVLAPVGLVVEHPVQPFPRCRASARKSNQVDVGR